MLPQFHEIESPLLVIALGVLLAIAAPAVTSSYSYGGDQAFNRLLDISQVLISGGLGGALFQPFRSSD